jgi:hypothetical protein
MAMTLAQLKEQLSSIEVDAATYAGIGPDEVPLLGARGRRPPP